MVPKKPLVVLLLILRVKLPSHNMKVLPSSLLWKWKFVAYFFLGFFLLRFLLLRKPLLLFRHMAVCKDLFLKQFAYRSVKFWKLVRQKTIRIRIIIKPSSVIVFLLFPRQLSAKKYRQLKQITFFSSDLPIVAVLTTSTDVVLLLLFNG